MEEGEIEVDSIEQISFLRLRFPPRSLGVDLHLEFYLGGCLELGVYDQGENYNQGQSRKRQTSMEPHELTSATCAVMSDQINVCGNSTANR